MYFKPPDTLLLSFGEAGMKTAFVMLSRAAVLALSVVVTCDGVSPAPGQESTPGGKNLILFSEPFRPAAERFK